MRRIDCVCTGDDIKALSRGCKPIMPICRYEPEPNLTYEQRIGLIEFYTQRVAELEAELARAVIRLRQAGKTQSMERAYAERYKLYRETCMRLEKLTGQKVVKPRAVGLSYRLGGAR